MLGFYTGEGTRWRVAGTEDESQWHPVSTVEAVESQLLENRGIGPTQKEAFLQPRLEDLHDPFRLEGIREAAERIVVAIREKQHLLIYGDYDVDGTTAVSILKNLFSDLGFQVSYYIPDRADEGYGISDVAVEKIVASPVDVVVTVDCGITARRQVEAIVAGRAALGRTIDILVTDHHQSEPDTLPPALVLVNPHLPGTRYPFRNLCGAGVAWKLAIAVATLMGRPELAMRSIDLAAFATIADIVELTGENRIIARYGIEKMNRDPHPGLAALHAVSGGKPGAVDSTRIGFIMAPRVNAAGRMGDAKEAVKLLTAKTPDAAMPIAQRLDETNRKRQEVQEAVFQQALAAIEARPLHAREPVTVVWGADWHHGVIGIVASKLVDRFGKPAFVLAVTDGEAVGSGRSIEGFDLFEALASQSPLLARYGGHAQAGGLTLAQGDLDAFREGVCRYAESRITAEMRIPVVEMEAELGPSALTTVFAERLRFLEPTGQANPAPLFLVRDVKVVEVRTLSEGKHLRLKVDKEGVVLACVGFGDGPMAEHLAAGDRIDLAGWLEINEFQGRANLQFRLEDVRLSASERGRNRFMHEAVRRFESLDCDGDWLYNGIVRSGQPKEAFFPTRDDLAAVFRHFRRFPETICTPGELFLLARRLAGAGGGPLGFFRMMAGLLVFDELGLVSLTLLPDGRYRLATPEAADRVDLEASELLALLQDVAARA